MSTTGENLGGPEEQAAAAGVADPQPLRRGVLVVVVQVPHSQVVQFGEDQA